MTGKRLLDISLTIPALVLLSPVLFIVALIVRITLGAPILFRQARPGQYGRIFTLLKFRTMTEARGPDGTPLPDASRMTRVGRFLRRTSLDELPELFNVLRGDMSLVGPRPLLPEYLCLYSTEQARRHEAKPGVTGWAQIHGRNAISWDRKFELDVWYVDHRSLGLDLRIVAATLGILVRGKGISAPGHATATKFTGGAS